MFWLLSIMVLDVVDEVVVNAKVVCALPVYSSTVILAFSGSGVGGISF